MMNKEYLNQCLDYDSEAGSFTWKKRPREHFNTDRGYNTFTSQKVGKLTGCISITKDGLAYVKIAINKKLYLAHRLAWIIKNGEIPKGYEIDHLDHDGTNNKISNLRIVTSSQNKMNRTMVSTNKTGCMGVYFNKRIKKWVAEITSGNQHTTIGYYLDKDKAILARKKAEVEFEFHENHGGSKIVVR